MRTLVFLCLVGCGSSVIVDDVEPDSGNTTDAGKDSTVTDAPKDAPKESSATDAAIDADDATTQDATVSDSGNCTDETAAPTTAMDVATIGTRAWTSPTNVYAKDNQFASVSAMINNEISHYIQVGGFGFKVPNNAQITGITLELDRKALSGVGLADHEIELVKNNTIQNTNKATKAIWNNQLQTVSYGGPNDNWQAAWTPADVNSASFGAVVAVRYTSVSGNDWPYIDQIRITVRHCP